MYKYKRLFLEITRECNKKCSHCLRGEPQEETMNKRIIDRILNNISDVEKLLLTGGEPLLKLDIIEYIIDCIIQHNFTLKKLAIVTNGTILDEKAIHIIKKLFNLNPNILIHLSISDSIFYDTKQTQKALRFYNKIIQEEKLNITLDTHSVSNNTILNEGRAIKYIENNRNEFAPKGNKFVVQPQTYLSRIKIKNNVVDYPILIGANGNVGILNLSYKNFDKISFGNIKEKSLDKIIDLHNESCLILDDEVALMRCVYANIEYLPENRLNPLSFIAYEFQRLQTLEVWHKRRLVKNILQNLPPSKIIDFIPIIPIEKFDYIDFSLFNKHSEFEIKKVISDFVWQQYEFAKKLNLCPIHCLGLINGIVDLMNPKRIDCENQLDIFLNDDNFMKSETFNALKEINRKIKDGMLIYDNSKIFE